VQTAKEVAEAAAKAVQEAEKANGLANELIAAADRYDRETPDEPVAKAEDQADPEYEHPEIDDPEYENPEIDDPEFEGD
jgi:hypothetical protein